MNEAIKDLIEKSKVLRDNLTRTGFTPIEEFIAALEVVESLTAPDPDEAEAEEAYRKAAKENYNSDGDLEFDDACVVSLSSDGGAYVQAWKWVSAAEADRCGESDCHGALDDGEGFGGKCGPCADRAEG